MAPNAVRVRTLKRSSCPLKQGTRPSRKITNFRDVKRYLHIAKDGLLVVHQADPLTSTRERIIVPHDVLEGLVTTLQIKLVHPSCHQLKKVIARYFYALALAGCVERVPQACHQCLALSSVPASLTESTTSDPSEYVGRSFAAVVMTRQKQMIFSSALCYCTAELLSSRGRPSSVRPSVRPSVVRRSVRKTRFLRTHHAD